MTLPILYKLTKTGAIQTYQVSTSEDLITVTQGQLEGKKQSYETKCLPKNVGRSNETTGTEQAILEAKSKHAKKIKAGYVLDSSGELTVKLPQKVKPYIGNESKIKFPAYSTPKLNGVNATYWLLPDGALSLTSRGGDEYPAIPHLETEIHKLMTILATTCLNGELYIHGEHLQDITSAVKKPKELSKQLEFSVFEAPLLADTYEKRRYKLNEVSVEWSTDDVIQNSKLQFLTGITVNSTKDIEAHYNQCMAAGLEGTVIYNADAPYQFNTRSSYVYKYKKAQDAEFQIVDCETDKNGHPVFHCTTPSGSVFKVKPKGTDSERKQIVRNFETQYLNKWYKIEFETYSKDNIPLKPVGIGLRNCTSNGVPLE